MKAAYIKKTGGPEVIEWNELPIPQIKDNEVLVKVSAVAVNPIDTYYRSGKYPITSMPMPFVIGRDLVGTVAQAGSQAVGFKPGQRVWCNSMGIHGRQGSFAEYVAVPQALLYHAPVGVDDREIAASIHAGATACLGLIREAMLKVSDTIFVNGGGGNIGTAIIQLAKGRGARVFAATSGKEKIEWCKSNGADLVVDYKTDDIEKKVKAAAPEGVNVYWDTSRQPNFDLAVSLLARKGRIILMAGSGSRPPFPVGPFYQKECSMKGFTLNEADAAELKQYADVINLCMERKQLRSKIAQVLPMAEAARAHALMESQPEVWGKVVLTT